MNIATKTIYQVIRTWTNYDGWDISSPTIEESFEDKADAEAYLARNRGDSHHSAYIKETQVQVAKPSSRPSA